MAAVVATLALVVPLALMWERSLLPDSFDMATMGYHDYGGGPVAHSGQQGGVPVADLVDDPNRPADVEEILTFTQDGDTYAINGTSPGPTISATEGDMVEVTLVNDSVADGATIHWHGVETPNAMDGVAGVTQDAVMPGEKFTYRFIADHAGTFWYHSHQISHAQVLGGLLGALIVEPATPTPDVRDEVVLLHRFSGAATLNGVPGSSTLDAEPGTKVRVRVINTDNGIAPIWVTGATFQVLAVDGYDVNQPESIEGRRFDLPAGGRVDLGLTVPDRGAQIDFAGSTTLVLGAEPTSDRQPNAPTVAVDLLSYGAAADPGIDTATADRRFDYRIGRRPGFLDGRPGLWLTINGRMYPDVPMFTVDEGDVVLFRIENTSGEPHPMHLHGHHALVISRDGVPASGSPWWTDSLEVRGGESYEVAFLADNPGLWMDHCHNLPHAAEGLVSHLMYTGVTSQFRIGDPHGNAPE
ncbi:MAG: multicopper oxidase family protein [Aeromicrobium sp.]